MKHISEVLAVTLERAAPPKPKVNGVVPPGHPWARFWIDHALAACEQNGAKWRGNGAWVHGRTERYS